PTYRPQRGAMTSSSGVANMYSYTPTPHCSLSRWGARYSYTPTPHCSLSRWVATPPPPTAPCPDCGSLISSQSSSATPSDNANVSLPNGRLPSFISGFPPSPGDEISSPADLPPPYTSNPPPASTLVAVRTSGITGSGGAAVSSVVRQHPQTAAVKNRLSMGPRRTTDVFVVGTGDHGCTTGMLSTFTQAPTAPITSLSHSTHLSPADLRCLPNFLSSGVYNPNSGNPNAFQFTPQPGNSNPNNPCFTSDYNAARYNNNSNGFENNLDSPTGSGRDSNAIPSAIPDTSIPGNGENDDSDSGRASNSVSSVSPLHGNYSLNHNGVPVTMNSGNAGSTGTKNPVSPYEHNPVSLHNGVSSYDRGNVASHNQVSSYGGEAVSNAHGLPTSAYHENMVATSHGHPVAASNSHPLSSHYNNPVSTSQTHPVSTPHNINIIESIKKRPPTGLVIGSFAPALQPITRPCSTAQHVIITASATDDTPTDMPPKMFNLTKF
ncbi:uncharacterized protein DDB_G0292186, partial [Hyalella azteca]|uniref:Uncharacterized protein DDB_G0292186 n=1 Tax=Hyalella azteca TaxID=294128 RepID=A0A8B7NZ39_HYAAZ